MADAEVKVRTAAWFLLLLSLAALLPACGGDAPRAAEPPAVAPEPITPRGPTEMPFVFSWKPVPGDPIYRVRVTDAAERVLYEQDVRATQCRPTTELKNMMTDHASFTWTVAILSADGTKDVARSAPVQFKLK